MIYDPYPQMFLFMKKRIYYTFSWMGLNCLKARMTTTLRRAFSYVLPLSSQKLLVLIFYQPLKDEQYKYQDLIQRKEYLSLSS